MALAHAALAAAMAPVAGCKPSLPSVSSKQCRRYATVMSYGTDTESTRTCTFSSNVYSCGPSCARTQRGYASLMDFIEEASVPNRSRLSVKSYDYSCGLGNTAGYSEQTYTYDAQKRLVKISTKSSWGYSSEPVVGVTEFTRWDGQGRPLSGTGPWKGQVVDISIVYDDAARTMTTSYGAGLMESTVQQDAFGNTIRDGSITYTVREMAEICL